MKLFSFVSCNIFTFVSDMVKWYENISADILTSVKQHHTCLLRAHSHSQLLTSSYLYKVYGAGG